MASSKRKKSKNVPLPTRLIGSFLIMSLIALISFGFINFGTFVHEVAGHNVAGWIFGCEVASSTDIFTGVTSFNCPGATEGMLVWIGLASIFVVFFVALALWLWAPDETVLGASLRFLAIIMFFYSIIPSAFPALQGSDMAYVVSTGFPLFLAWFIYILIIGVFGWLMLNEIIERNYFRGWFE